MAKFLNYFVALQPWMGRITGFHAIDFASRDWKQEQAIFDVDIFGFFALARTGLAYFEQQKHGHLVGFSSVDGLRRIGSCLSYSAAKSFCSPYLEAERNYYTQKNIPITITDIIPGWINSNNEPDFQKKYPHACWIESLDDATADIFEAIKNKDKIAYITKRWKQVADTIATMPDDLYSALGGL